MNYKIILNVPNEKNITEISITKEQLEKLEPQINLKRIIKIDTGYYNTAYIVKIIPDADANRLSMAAMPKLEETTQTLNDKRAAESMKKLKDDLIAKKVISDN